MDLIFKITLGANPSIYAFLSGLMISVSTSAVSSITLSINEPSYHPSAKAIGLLAFVAGLIWFLLSERVASHNRQIERLLNANLTREKAIQQLVCSEKRLTIIFSSCALVLSFSWPFARILWPC